MYKLIIEDDEGKTTVVPLIRDEITIGRKEGNTIRLTERNVSRRHAKLVKANGSVVIEDLQSYNGIKVNGDRISGRAPVNEGDRIQIGDYQLALKVEKAKEEDATIPFDKTGITTAPQAPVSDGGTTQLQPVLAADSDRPARLAVVSSNFAGQEFVLDKAAVVIGRTDENDVVINHRSISRHHAKIVREGGHYHVVDLQSANGVRVNGEEYGKVELRKGDHIDLGHVRMRFVAPGEDFVFSRDAKVVEVTGSDKKGKGMLIAIAAVAVLVLGGGAIVIMKVVGGGGGSEKGEPSGKIAAIAMEVDRLIKSQEWPAAVDKAEEGLKIDPSSEVLRDKKVKAESELKNKAKYEEYSKALKEKDFERAVIAYQEIPNDSVYHEKASETWEIVRTAYVAKHLAEAQRKAQAGKCEEARKDIELVLLVDETNTDAQELAKKCGGAPPPRVHRDTGPRPDKPHGEPRPSKPVAVQETRPAPAPEPPPQAPKPAAEAGGDCEKTVAEAMDDYVHGNYTVARDKARKANHGSCTNKAWRIIGASSCFLKEHDEAARAWNKLGNMDRQFIKYVCDRNQLKIP
jgi:pSer/pThr/pTyr-binding forkhead associated (FHA) protein